jgi:hypothetical protein
MTKILRECLTRRGICADRFPGRFEMSQACQQHAEKSIGALLQDIPRKLHRMERHPTDAALGNQLGQMLKIGLTLNFPC